MDVRNTLDATVSEGSPAAAVPMGQPAAGAGPALVANCPGCNGTGRVYLDPIQGSFPCKLCYPNAPVREPMAWKCTGYTHGCFCPSCNQRDIDRARYINAGRYGHG